jgi:hypothetical protein
MTVASTGSITELYKPYPSRNNSTLPRTLPVKPTGSVPKPPVLQLSKTECAAGRKTSSTPLQEVHKTSESVNIITTNSSLKPLYDDSEDSDDCDDDADSLKQSLHYHHLTSSMFHEKQGNKLILINIEDGLNVLKELTKLPPETGRTMVCTSTLVN